MPVAILGRERELAAVEQLLERAEEGAEALVFEGEPGIGKTTVWAEAVERARSRCVVLSARPAYGEAQMSFAALADLLEPVDAGAIAALPEPQRAAISIAMLHEEPVANGLGGRAVAAATLNLLRTLSGRGPVLVAIDDLQWLDRPSARALEFVARRLRSLRVGILGCERIADQQSTSLNLDGALPNGRIRRFPLRPLSPATLDQIVRERLGQSLSRSGLRRIGRASAGNPFFAIELARLQPANASQPSALPMPDSLREIVEDRIAELPKGTRQILLTAAALGSPTTVGVLSSITDPDQDFPAALEPAVATGVITMEETKVEFTHPLFAEAVYSLAPLSERRCVHLRLARAVDGIEERARHLAGGTPLDAPDPGVAEILDAAAEHARRRGAPDVAADLAEHGRLLTAPDDEQAMLRRSTRSAEYHFHAGELERAHGALDSTLAAAPSGEARAHALRVLGEMRYHEESANEANQLFEEALEHVGSDVPLRCVLHLDLAYGLNSTGDVGSAVAHGGRALELAEQVGDRALHAEALAVTAIADALAGHGVDADKVERALALEDPNRQIPVALRPSLIAGCLALYEGRLERSAQLLLPLRQRVTERGEESDLAFVACNLTWAACWGGELEAAAAYADEAVESASRTQGEFRCLSLAFAAVQAAYAGAPEVVRSRAEECRTLAPSASIAVLWAAWSEAVLALSLGDPKAAHESLGPLAAPFEAGGIPHPARAFFVPDEIEALVGVEQLEQAERLLARFAEAAERTDARWPAMMTSRCRALLLAAGGEIDDAAREIGVALDLCAGLELRIEVARTMLVAGRIQRRRRQKKRARIHLEEARERFETMGARLWADRCRAELDRVGIRPSAPEGLTPSEWKVAELTATGLKNREVAAQLFLSPKTIEATLARVYRKLDIHSRAELGARLADPRGPPTKM